MTTPRELRSIYLATQVEVEIEPHRWVTADEVIDHLAAPLFVITACNPLGSLLTETENLQRMGSLQVALDDVGAEFRNAIGVSPSRDWIEPSFAITGIGRRKAKKLGRTYEQNAIFEITADELIVLGCDGSWIERRPLLIDPTLAEADDLATLPEAILSTLGLSLSSSYRRAAYRGWMHEPGLGAPCSTCGHDLELFGCESRGRDGSVNRLMAFVCPGCAGLSWPHEVGDRVRECAKRRREFLLAAEDAERVEAEEVFHSYVIELAGDVDQRDPDSDPELPWVYVGQSSYPAEERFVQHMNGQRPSRWVRRFGTHLRPDLYLGHPPLRNKRSSLTYEAWLAASLQSRGYSVKGGH